MRVSIPGGVVRPTREESVCPRTPTPPGGDAQTDDAADAAADSRVRSRPSLADPAVVASPGRPAIHSLWISVCLV